MAQIPSLALMSAPCDRRQRQDQEGRSNSGKQANSLRGAGAGLYPRETKGQTFSFSCVIMSMLPSCYSRLIQLHRCCWPLGHFLKYCISFSEMKEEGGVAPRVGVGRRCTLSQMFLRGSVLGPNSGLFAIDLFSQQCESPLLLTLAKDTSTVHLRRGTVARTEKVSSSRILEA